MWKDKRGPNQTSRDEKPMLQIKNTPDGINMLNATEEKISEFEGTAI